MKYFVFLILSSLFCRNIICQNSINLDSLYKALPTQKEDTSKVKTYINICNKIVYADPNKSLEYGHMALVLSEGLKWNKGMALAYSVIADACENQGDNSKALEFRLKELKIWQELNNKLKICGVYGNIGVSYSNLGNNLKALEYYISSLNLAEKIGHKKIMVNSQVNIASIYYELDDPKKALEHYYKALELAEVNNFENSTAEINCNLGQIFSDEGDYSKALQYQSNALEIFTRLDRKMNLAMLLENIGLTISLQGDSAITKGNPGLAKNKYLKSREYFNKALKLSEELSNDYLTASLLGNLGKLLGKVGKHKESEEYLKRSLEIATKINAIDVIQDVHYGFYTLYKEISQPNQSLDHFERFSSIKDSISEKDNQKAISELQVKYDIEKKETEILSLDQQNKILELSVKNNKYLTLGLLIILILLLGFGYLMVRQNKIKSSQENSKLEQRLLRTQMNPHFIFNSLSSIESFIYEHQPKEAGNYLSQFARLMRLILENSASEYITLEKELETLRYYLSLQKLRLNDNLQYNIDVDEKLDAEQVLIPPMLTQPFIENVIEHGFRGIKECGIINIGFKLKDNYLEIKITDNGIGLAQAQQQKDLFQTHKSMAIKITYERLKFLNKSKNQKLVFSIKEAPGENQGKGTEVIFSIPV